MIYVGVNKHMIVPLPWKKYQSINLSAFYFTYQVGVSVLSVVFIGLLDIPDSLKEMWRGV